MSADRLQDAATVDLVDQHGHDVGTVPTAWDGVGWCMELTAAEVDATWLLRFRDGAGQVLGELPTPTAAALQELVDGIVKALSE